MSEEFEALIHPSDDGKFWAEVIGLHGCYSQGDNYSKIMASLRDAHELCNGSPGAGTPPPAELGLGEDSTAADLCAALAAQGWAETGAASAAHKLLGHAGSGAILCVPLDGGEVLNVGYRSAVSKYLGEG